MTYNHDESVMQQFLVGETGAGSFTPDWYYDVFYGSYRNNAMQTNKQLYRTQLKLCLTKEEPLSETIDTTYNDRLKVEMLNMADRTPGVSDFAWQIEKGKIESKLAIFKSNIERITLEGGSSQSYREWLDRYNAIYCGLQAVRDAYMPQGSRKEQYIAIYKDILVKTAEVCSYVTYLRNMRAIKSLDSSSVPKSDVARIARSAHGRWKVSLSAVTGSKKGNSTH